MLRNSFSLKHLLMASGKFWAYCGQNLAGSNHVPRAISKNTSFLITTSSSFPLSSYSEKMCWRWGCAWLFMSIYGSKIQGIKKKRVEKTLLSIFLTVKTKWPNVWAPNFFSTFLDSKIQKIVVYSKPSIKIIGILLLIVRFVKS